MKVATPKIDSRVFAQLLQEAKTKALFYTPEWNAAQDKDAGQALLKIYLRLYEGVIRQLNKTPEKNLVAFLDSLGMELQPAQSARAIVTFSLAEGTKEHVLVPKGTQLAAEGLDGEEAIFETDEPVRLTPALLQQVYSVDARKDEIYEHTSQFRNAEAFDLLAGPNKQEHSLYIGHTDVLNQLNPSKITVEFTITSGASDEVLELIWEYWNGERWVALRTFKPGGSGTSNDNDTTDLLSKSGTMIIEKPYIGEFAEKELRPNAPEDSAKFKSRWLRCRVANKLSSTSQVQLPEVDTIRLCVNPIEPFPADLAFNNDIPLNLEEISRNMVHMNEPKLAFVAGKFPQQGDTQFDVTIRPATSALIVGDFLKLDNSFDGPEIVTIKTILVNGVEIDRPIQFTYDEKPTSTIELFTALRPGNKTFKVESLKGLEIEKGQKVDLYHLSEDPQRIEIDAVNTASDEIVLKENTKFYIAGDRVKILPKIKPYGELPALFDTFYIASDEAFSKRNAKINLNIASSWKDFAAGDTATAALSWEYWNGKSWRGLRVADTTEKFNHKGTVSFTCPEDISKIEVNGEEKFWVRVRIIDGDFGKELIIEPAGTSNPLEVKISKGKIKYPIINELTINYEDVPREPQYCVSFNNLDFEDHIEALRDQARSFQPFKILPEADPGVFLGFDKPLEGGPLRILFNLEEQSRSSDNPVKIQWSYWNGNSWAVINATDGTESLSCIGLLDLIIGSDFVVNELFDDKLFWLKGSVIAGELTQPPQKTGELPQPTRLYGISSNSVFATQVATVQDEPLGSSNGQTTQSFSFLHPLIVSQEVFVRETVELTDEEKAQTIIEEGEEAITPEVDETGEIVAYKIRWHEVDDFDDSTPKSRHYTVDKRLGIVRFGDGVRGMIPPPGADNIRANYKFGGGKNGNVEAGKIASLKNAIPFVSEVINHLAAGGGSPTETLDEVLVRGPQTLKHRDRAMSSVDFEALARDASRSVARARCLTNTDENGELAPGHITVVIVPDTQKADERPTRLLRDVVADSLKKKAANTVVAADHIHVTGANYVKLTVKPTIVPVSLNAAAQVEQDLLSALQRYIHPLTGGPCGSGWEFGRGICRSEIFALLEGIKDVDHVADLKLSIADKEQDGDVTILPNQLVFSGEHKINFTLEDRPQNGARKTLFSECLETPNDKILDPEQCGREEERVLAAF